ncbi:Putative metallopeptidase (Zinc) SprT family [Streptococcus thermophilus]|nr:Putative metallopeptidase (Zinc) SprT family [Streptococcus thermophilus]
MRNQAENYFLYQCQSCGHTYRRKRRVNTQKFGCGLCQGKLIFLNQS